MFRISDEPLETLVPELEMGHVGAIASFDGIVRDLNEGLAVHELEYECFEPLALKEGSRIIDEARSRFPIVDAWCVHRTGVLEPGDLAIRVAAAAVHRREAFEACEYIVEQVKARVPIWKKEHYRGGTTEWLNTPAAEAHETCAQEREYYSRQVRLSEVGDAGQRKLKAAKVLVVGAGGLGCPALMYLAAAGVGTIGIVDSDMVELSNLHRQVLFTVGDAGAPKASVAATRLAALNPFIEVSAHVERLDSGSATRLLGDYDLVLDCTDNFETKFLLNDVAMRLGKRLVVASIYQYEGQILTVEPNSDSGCLRCQWPEEPLSDCVGSCADVGVVGAVPGVLGSLQAIEALRLILGLTGGGAERHLVLLDLLSLKSQRIARRRSLECPTCLGFDIAMDWRIGPDEIEGMLLVDIRESEELPVLNRPHERAPMSSFDASRFGGASVVLVCATGKRSSDLARRLRDKGYDAVYSLSGGIMALNQ